MLKSTFILMLTLFSISGFSQHKIENKTQARRICESDLQWSETKPPLLPGAKVSLIDGDPKSDGHFTMRLIFPPYYKVPPHTHPVDERTTVLRGSIYLGLGDVLDTTNAKKLTAGCFYLNPKGVHHYFFTSEEETEIQISTNGPWGLEVVGK